MSEERTIEVVYRDPATIHANEYNPNAMSERTYEAARESIRIFGFLQPIIVRTHPKLEGAVEVIDGEHRWKAATDEKLAQVPTILVDGFTDAEVKKLTLALNMHGEAEIVPLGKLLAELSLSMQTLDELRLGLPFADSELAELIKIGQISWDSFSGDGQAAVEDFLNEGGSGRSDTSQSVTLAFDEAQRQRFVTFIEMLSREADENFTPEDAVLDALSTACQAL